MVFVLVSLILVALTAFYLYLSRNYKYWQKRGIPCPDGVLPGIGHMFWMLCMRMSIYDYCRKICKDYRGRSMVGFYNFTSPSLIILEPELVKTVLQTNFSSFAENTVQIDPKVDPLAAHNPAACTGEKWMNGRKRLTYAFSSMRLKILLESVKPVCATLEKYIDEKISKTGKAEMELKELFSRYTAQVVAAAGFGVDGLCFDDEKENESFRKIGAAFLEPNTHNAYVFFFVFFAPALNKILKMRFIPEHIDHFFRTLVADLMQQRRTDGIPRNDFLHLMAELEKIQDDKFDLEILASYALSFVVDGYETSSTVMSFIGFQLASHPEVQDRLREEVMTVLDKYDGVITYDALQEMTYMDQVISESQRFTPAAATMHKLCTKECELRGSDGLVCRVQPGTEVIIPVYGLQEDPRFWDDPEVFDPDRFSLDRKQSIEKYAFLPFGEGPRMCVGMRMALLQIKAGLSALLKKYRLELSPKTQIPLEMLPTSILLAPKGGLWINFRHL